MNAVLAADLVVIRRTVPVMCVEAVQVASRRPWQGVGTGTSLLQAAGRWAYAARLRWSLNYKQGTSTKQLGYVAITI